jgi:transposase
VREGAVRLVFDNEAQHPSRWQAVMSIAAKIGCTPQTLVTVRPDRSAAY